MTGEDREWLVERALAAGFDVAGMAPVPDAESEAAALLDARYAAWIAEGRAGGMEYLKRTDELGQLVRGDVRRAFPWARSVLVCAVEYGPRDAPRSIDAADAGAGWIARYAWSGEAAEEQLNSGIAEQQNSVRTRLVGDAPRGSDYHEVLLPRLKAIEAEMKGRFGEALETRCYVDTGPIVERAIATWAGVGWIGKNTCLLNEGRGSFVLLGVIVTSLELAAEAWAMPAADRCGSCTRCIDACPTDALVAPRQMDASRCIAYLTIEHKGAIEEGLRAEMGRQVFGCDICQDVCPWNGEAARRVPAAAWREEKENTEDTKDTKVAQREGKEITEDTKATEVAQREDKENTEDAKAAKVSQREGKESTADAKVAKVAQREDKENTEDAKDTKVTQREGGMSSRGELMNPSLEWLGSMDNRAFKQWFRGSPLERTGKKRLHRNVAIAMGNSGELRFLPQLEAWAAGEDAVLAETARWAIEHIQRAGNAAVGADVN